MDTTPPVPTCVFHTEFTCGADVVLVNFLFDCGGPVDASLLRLDAVAKEYRNLIDNS